MSMQRRRFVQSGVGALLGASAFSGSVIGASGAVEAGARRLTDFGLQLSTITPLMMRDFEGTLREVAALGYTQVEFSALGLLGRSAGEVKALLAEIGLEAPVGRVSPRMSPELLSGPREQLMGRMAERGQGKYLVENARHAIEDALAFGQKVINLPALMPNEFETLDQVKRNIEHLNVAGEVCAEAGIMFGYHNHDWELMPIDGVVPYDLMIEQTDPDKVSFQLDTYWIVKGGASLGHYLGRYSGRFNSCHLKDIDDEGDFEDVGHGNIDFPRFVAQAEAAGAAYFFVERDRPPDPRSAMRRSIEYLREMTYS